MPTDQRSEAIGVFAGQIARVLDTKGKEEYGNTAAAIYSVLGVGAPAYAIIEKGLRYGKKGNVEDLIKAAAYAFLEWERQRKSDEWVEIGLPPPALKRRT